MIGDKIGRHSFIVVEMKDKCVIGAHLLRKTGMVVEVARGKEVVVGNGSARFGRAGERTCSKQGDPVDESVQRLVCRRNKRRVGKN